MTIRMDRASAILARVGLPGGAAMALAGFAAWMHVVMVPESEAAATALRRLANAPAPRAVASSRVPPTPEALIGQAIEALPDDASSNATFAEVLAQAKVHGLQVDAVQFQSESARVVGVRRHRAVLPLRGHYADMRSWLSDTLRDEPGITLDAIDLQRKDLGAADLEMRVNLSLWTREFPVRTASASADSHVR